MIYLRFNNKTVKEKFEEVIKTNPNPLSSEVVELLNSKNGLEYSIPHSQLKDYKQFLTEISNILPLTYYYIKGTYKQWYIVEDLSSQSEIDRDYLDVTNTIKFAKHKNDADIYIRDKTKESKNLSGRDEWRSKTGGID